MNKAIQILGYRNAERFVRELSLIRRSLELLNLDVDDYDKKLNEWGERYFKEFSEMGVEDMMMIMSASMRNGDEQ